MGLTIRNYLKKLDIIRFGNIAFEKVSEVLSSITKKSTGSVKNVFVLRTHVLNGFVLDTYNRMQAQLGAENVFILFDETNGSVRYPHTKWDSADGIFKGPGIITINETDCERINSLHRVGEKPNSKYIGSVYRVEAQVYACFKAIRCDYDYMWFIEYDVYCNDFKKALSRFDKVQADMLSKGRASQRFKSIRTVKKSPHWWWWGSLVGEISNVSKDQLRGCFFPINRFSRKFLEVLEKNLSKSSGYCEVYFPTLCYINGLKLKAMPLSVFGTFLYRPALTKEQISKIDTNDHRLYHPVKELAKPLSAEANIVSMSSQT